MSLEALSSFRIEDEVEQKEESWACNSNGLDHTKTATSPGKTGTTEILEIRFP
jgi:hypothetical protein